MHIKRIWIVSFFFALSALSASAIAGEKDNATAEEVVEKVRQAAAVLAEEGDGALPMFSDPNSAYVWKDTYVFVSDCDEGVILAHPTQRDRVGKKIADGPTYAGVTAAERAQAQCETAARPGGGWWAYEFVKPGSETPTRKVSYMVMVEGRPWLVGAGVYDQTTPIEEFEAVSRNAP